MKKARGKGFVYNPGYIDKRTGERRTASTWWIQYFIKGAGFRESSNSGLLFYCTRTLFGLLHPNAPCFYDAPLVAILDACRKVLLSIRGKNTSPD
jgi:hypothetical protein